MADRAGTGSGKLLLLVSWNTASIDMRARTQPSSDAAGAVWSSHSVTMNRSRQLHLYTGYFSILTYLPVPLASALRLGTVRGESFFAVHRADAQNGCRTH